jgi:pimeloyl-ACP methyl ester carboxylesterase
LLSSTSIRLRRGPELEVIRGGKGPALVWLHGMAVASTADPLLAALARDLTVIAPVAPGRRSADELDELPTLHDLVLLYDSALEALGVRNAAIVGHGFGGMLAAELAAAAPHRVRTLTLISPLGLWNDAHPVEDLFARPYPAVDELIWSGAVSPPPPRDASDEDVEDLIALANGLGAIARYTWPIPDRGLKGRLYRVDAPTLLMFAEADAWVPRAYARDFAEELADARVHSLPGSHMAPYERPAETARIIADFARAVSAVS